MPKIQKPAAWQSAILINRIPARLAEPILNEPTGAMATGDNTDFGPPSGFSTEELLLIKPFSFYVKCFTLPDLFAGKMHALLFRKWKSRVKGRDWYDMEWYIKKGVALNLQHFVSRARDSHDWNKSSMSETQFKQLLTQKIESVSFNSIREDVQRFIPDRSSLDIWGPTYFKDLVRKLKFQ